MQILSEGTLTITRSQLNDDKKKEYDQIVNEMMAEIDHIPREKIVKDGFSSYLAKKY